MSKTSTTTTTSPSSSSQDSQDIHKPNDPDTMSRYRECPSWMDPYYVNERLKDREGHRRRIGDVIKDVEGVLGTVLEDR
ncbi:hypothetical protein BDV25DRAFT_146898 [Aspergillus avenaceus]|uniref:Uncharacterized protein n=1 Tax=Aspergillus avenaceus TaxID=36643 RepID=A0A5N6U9F0_ASPAV|nr:hypothetical protein BDV25DRAFT_146898 [Aspergillus avenaceus]